MGMTFQIELTNSALKELSRLDKIIAQQIITKTRWLSENIDMTSLSALTADFNGLFKLRVGNYRIIYSINYQDKIITIHSIGHRRDIYK
jgi:mRNA interferase RelE/StbE